MQKKSIVNFYIDGFNIYHRIKRYQRISPDHKCYKWLNYRSLFESLLGKDECMGRIYFFTAIPKGFFGWDKIERHNIYLEALRSVSIVTITGKFRPDEKTIYRSRSNFIKVGFPREKQTDIKIATFMLRHAYTLGKEYLNKLYLMSGDTDFIPVIKEIRERTDKKVGLITRPYRPKIIGTGNVGVLYNECSIDSTTGKPMVKKLKFNDLNGHSFKKEIQAIDGKTIIKMSKEYQTF